jgi:hypothetical protein
MYDMPDSFPQAGRGAVVFYIALYVVQAIALYQLAKKANVRKPWVSFIPVLQTIVFLHIIDKSGWCIFLFLIPVVNIILAIIWAVKFYLAFDVKPGLIVLSIIIPIAGLVMMLVMAFSDRYNYVKTNSYAPEA